jgi:hypothetical protein
MRRKRPASHASALTPRRIAVKNLEALPSNSPAMSAWWRSRSACFRGPCRGYGPARRSGPRPQTLHRVRASLRDEPARLRVLEGRVWHVYRESGALVMCDDTPLPPALELGAGWWGSRFGEVASQR